MLFFHAAREPARDNGCDPLPQEDWAPVP